MINKIKSIPHWQVDYAIIGLLFVFLYTLVFDPKLDLNGDNASYYLHGKGIAEGLGYVQYHIEGQPKAHHYPVGYPVIIAGVITLFGESIFAVKRINGLFFLISIWLVYSLTKRLTDSRSTALTTSILILFNSILLRYSTIMMSEMSFLMVSLGVLYLIAKTDLNRTNPVSWQWLAIIALLGFAYFIRTSAIALVFGLGTYLVFEKRWKLLLSMVIGFALFPLAWTIRNKVVGINSHSHFSQLLAVNPYAPSQGTVGLNDLFTRFIENFTRYISLEINHSLFPFIPVPWGGSGVTAFILGLGLVGIILYGLLQIKKHKSLLISYLAGSLGILMLWPTIWSGPRFILPLLPILMLGFVSGSHHLLLKGARLTHWDKITPYWILALLVLFVQPITDEYSSSKANYPIEWESYFQSALWFRENTDKANTKIVCRKPELFSIYSNRHTARYRFETDPQKHYAWMREKNVSHVIFAPMLSLSPLARKMQNAVSQDQHYLGPMLETYKDSIEVISHIEEVDLWIIALKE